VVVHFVLATYGGAEEGEDEDDVVDCGFVEADAPPPATGRREDGDGWEEGGSAAERAARASLSGLGQRERQPLPSSLRRHLLDTSYRPGAVRAAPAVHARLPARRRAGPLQSDRTGLLAAKRGGASLREEARHLRV